MSAPESTVVLTPPAPPAPASATVEQIGALHRRIDEIESWVAEKLHELLHLLEKAAPVVEKVAAAAAPVLGAAAAPVVAAVEKVAEGVVTCCGHVHFGTCAENCPVCSKAAAK